MGRGFIFGRYSICTYVGLLCDLRSEQQVTQLIKEAEDLKQEYKTQQAQFHQLARIKDRMQKCQKALQDKTGDLKFEENVKLLEEGLEKNQRKPYGSQGSWIFVKVARACHLLQTLCYMHIHKGGTGSHTQV